MPRPQFKNMCPHACVRTCARAREIYMCIWTYYVCTYIFLAYFYLQNSELFLAGFLSGFYYIHIPHDFRGFSRDFRVPPARRDVRDCPGFPESRKKSRPGDINPESRPESRIFANPDPSPTPTPTEIRDPDPESRSRGVPRVGISRDRDRESRIPGRDFGSLMCIYVQPDICGRRCESAKCCCATS